MSATVARHAPPRGDDAQTGADRLLLLTDVPAVIRGYGTPRAQPIRTIDTDTLARMTITPAPQKPAALR